MKQYRASKLGDRNSGLALHGVVPLTKAQRHWKSSRRRQKPFAPPQMPSKHSTSTPCRTSQKRTRQWLEWILWLKAPPMWFARTPYQYFVPGQRAAPSKGVQRAVDLKASKPWKSNFMRSAAFSSLRLRSITGPEHCRVSHQCLHVRGAFPCPN